MLRRLWCFLWHSYWMGLRFEGDGDSRRAVFFCRKCGRELKTPLL